ncbi:MAG: hypothetical protein DWQ36_22700 [Acidobacteria bacterium]|nr:MAG: hypothetical protein DWQ30_01775 [Acidobacteriota bacterium]REK00500.1 MAG: hypothetical protein DWQ36_22700 [Acidobacteriota bacterium]
MPLDLIGVGFGRTGTASLRLALNRLGYPCYHMFEVLEVPRNKPAHPDFWLEVARSPPGAQHDWERVFADYRATVDNPGATVWRELIEAYPHAKVLLSLHPGGPETWYRSTWETIYSPQYLWQARVVKRWIPALRRVDEMHRELIWNRFHRRTMTDERAAIERYVEHQREVEQTVPPERLLVYDVSQGWEPLCAFLGEPVPDEPFPRTNDRAEMKRRLGRMRWLGAAMRVAEIGVLLAAGVLLARWVMR